MWILHIYILMILHLHVTDLKKVFKGVLVDSQRAIYSRKILTNLNFRIITVVS